MQRQMLQVRRFSQAAVLVAFLLPAAGCDVWSIPDRPASAEVPVMTQNLYLGADLLIVAGEPDPTLIPLRVAEFYAQVQATDFPARAEVIADEIERKAPALIGLQEVTTYYVQTPSDYVLGVTEPNATDVTYDFLQTLLAELAERGLDYAVASHNSNSDVELPGTTDGVTFFDVRYQDADVVLARGDVATHDPVEATYQALLTIPVGGVPQTYVRGYQYVTATVDETTLTFFNTHLEVGGDAGPVQEAQAAELKAVIDGTGGPVVLAGDLNSPADGSGTASYALLTASLTDAALRAPTPNAPTCCQAADLQNATSALTTRIDYVLYRDFARVTWLQTVLDEPADKTPSGLWPSDHAGVVALLVRR